MAVSNNIIAVLNFIAFLCSIPIIVSGIWLASKQDNECIRLLRWPVILIGVLILLVSLTGFVGAFWNKQGLLLLYLIAMAVLIVLLLFLLIFAFVVTRPDGSKPVYGRGYKEYYLGGFSGWLRNYVTDPGRWTKIQRCLSESDVCTKMGSAYMTPEQFYGAHLSPLQASLSLSFFFSHILIFPSTLRRGMVDDTRTREFSMYLVKSLLISNLEGKA